MSKTKNENYRRYQVELMNSRGASLEAIIKKYHAYEVVVETLKNGIQKVNVYDKYDNLINTYHK